MLSVISADYARELLGPDWSANENFLTAEFFGLLRYAPASTVAAILGRATAFPKSEPCSVPRGYENDRWEIELWPVENDGTSPDGRIRLLDEHRRPKLDLVLEVKLFSGPSDKRGKEPQLVRYGEIAKRRVTGGLLYLTLDPPDTAATGALERVVGSGVPVLLLEWNQVADVVFVLRQEAHQRSPLHVLLDDLYRILRSRGIMAVSDVPAVKLGDNVEIQAAHALVLEYCRQVVDMVASVNATCKGRGLLFKYWSTPDGSRSRADRLPDSSAATALPLVYSDFTWRTGIGKGDNAEGSTWVVMEHCADASIHDAQTAAPGEKGSFLAVFVARPAPAFRKEAFEKSWRKCMAEHFDCGGADPDHLFSPRVHRGAFGELHAWRIDAAQLSSGAEFDRLILQPLREAIDGVMKRQG